MAARRHGTPKGSSENRDPPRLASLDVLARRQFRSESMAWCGGYGRL